MELALIHHVFLVNYFFFLGAALAMRKNHSEDTEEQEIEIRVKNRNRLPYLGSLDIDGK